MPPFHFHNLPAPVAIALRCTSLASLAGELARQKYMAIALAVAGSAYMDSGFGAWEFPAAIAIAFCVARGLQQQKRDFGGYYAISAGWLLHTAWDVLHHVWELPIVRWIPTFFDRVCRHGYPIGTVDATWCPRDL